MICIRVLLNQEPITAKHILHPDNGIMSQEKLLPLEAFLLLSLLADLRELPFIVLPRSALLGFAPGVVLHSLHLLLPRFHQLVIALADLLFLRTQYRKCYIRSGPPSLQ